MTQLSRIADSFLMKVQALPPGPGADLDSILASSLEEEAVLRHLFVEDHTNPLLSDPYLGLVNIFEGPSAIRVTRAQVVRNRGDHKATHVLPLKTKFRRDEGAPAMVDTLDEFRAKFHSFTGGSLQSLNWDNVVVAGGSVLACLSLPLSPARLGELWDSPSDSPEYRGSDVDLFLFGLTVDEAEQKMKEIFETIRTSVSCPVVCVRTKHAVTIHAEYPIRPVQIILRLYKSPSEILTGFDVDACCLAFDGRFVWGNPRSIIAMMRQCNTINLTRRSPSYEIRLAKYAERGFEILVPDLERRRIDPTIYDFSFLRLHGLARLLIFENLVGRTNQINIDSHLEETGDERFLRGMYRGDIRHKAGVGSVVELSDYDRGLRSVHVPFGPGWTAERVDLELAKKDVLSNLVLSRKYGIHRHYTFLGTMEQCLEDCCGNCPVEGDHADSGRGHIRGRVSFVQANPGRQGLTGSFNPMPPEEWYRHAYECPPGSDTELESDEFDEDSSSEEVD